MKSPKEQAKGSKMRYGISKGSLYVALLILFHFALPGEIHSFDKKIKVTADIADIHLDPDTASPVIETLEKGSILALLYGGKVKKIWYYVCFKSEKTKITKTGYIIDSLVEFLFQAQKVVAIKGEEQIQKQPEAPFDARNDLGWGISKDRILEREGEPRIQDNGPKGDIMEYRQENPGSDWLVRYVFEDNRLTTRTYYLLEYFVDKNRYIDTYKNLKSFFAREYGEPEEDTTSWHVPTFKNEARSWGHAVSLGHLEYKSLWMTPGTEIGLNLRGGDNTISLEISLREIRVEKSVPSSKEERDFS